MRFRRGLPGADVCIVCFAPCELISEIEEKTFNLNKQWKRSDSYT